MDLVLCPVYNEKKTIKEFFFTLRKFYKMNLLFVNDGSTDGTDSIIEEIRDRYVYIITNKKRQGYGEAILNGFKFAIDNGYKRIITIDGDMQHNPGCIPVFLKLLEKYEVVLGTRYARIDGYLEAPLERLMINKFITTLINSLFSTNFTDSFCGLRGYRDSFLKRAKLEERSYGFAIEILLEMVRTKVSYIEVPVDIIYTGQDRKFLDGLNDPSKRLKHYLDVILRSGKIDVKAILGSKSSPG